MTTILNNSREAGLYN